MTPTMQLQDALDRLLADPHAAVRWHALLDAFYRPEVAESRLLILTLLEAHLPASGLAVFLHATFLSVATGSAEATERAARLIQEIEPFDGERLMWWAQIEWGRAVAEGGGFAARLRTLDLPRILFTLGATLDLPDHAPPAQVAACAAAARQGAPGWSRALTPVRSSGPRRIALLAPTVSVDSHPPTDLALQHARLLLQQGCHVHLFSSQDMRMEQVGHYLGNRANIKMQPLDTEALRRRIPPGAQVTLCSPGLSLRRRWFDLQREIEAFGPDLILFVGFISPLVQSLWRRWPVLGLSTHATQPLAACDLWLSSRQHPAGQTSDSWGPWLPPALPHFHPWRIALKPTAGPARREEFGLSGRNLVLISVGYRLHLEIAGEFAVRMRTWLAAHPDAVWLLVGGTGTCPEALHGCPQIRPLPHQDDVRRVLGLADLYLNPVRTGGGFSVAEAMADGVAAVALRDGDGGDKLQEFASPDLEAYFATLAELSDGEDAPARRRERAGRLQAAFAARLDLSTSGPALLAACERCLQVAHRSASESPSAQVSGN